MQWRQTMTTDEEILFERETGQESETDNIESIRKKFEGQMI